MKLIEGVKMVDLRESPVVSPIGIVGAVRKASDTDVKDANSNTAVKVKVLIGWIFV